MNMPVTLKVGDIMSEDEFFRFCRMNDMLDFERDSNGNIIFMSPTDSFTGSFNSDILIEIGVWLHSHKVQGKLFDSSTGFTLPNGAVRSPDISWVSRAKWDGLSKENKEKFAPVCPEFIVEVRSKSDDLKYLLNKMEEYMNNGCQLGWVIDRFEEKVYVYALNQEVVRYESIDIELRGEPLFPGLVLDLSAIER
ncbi:Uma2 family endonuclease [Dyadobacter sp. CY312]|uniref:Uma2 family endonuclease n=1 Tax=Dyadobacter sp. CY312 TaxID=2907303 RepID=UPI001F1FFF76|nr:Uma2 family endonuclease [Dyadobacter sp. CY312]MCE7041907.1 Uma2 family endonuclease [Dyadobacter sp. CY312]